MPTVAIYISLAFVGFARILLEALFLVDRRLFLDAVSPGLQPLGDVVRPRGVADGRMVVTGGTDPTIDAAVRSELVPIGATARRYSLSSTQSTGQ